MDTNPSIRTIEDICSVNGHRAQPVPPLPASSAPNFGEIRKVYDSFFASGLDHLLETGSSQWFTINGFALLAGDRSLLAQFMLYLTLISSTANTTTAGPEQAALMSQESRMVWALLNLCVRPAQEGGDEEAEKLARRVKAIEALLTGEPIVRTGSMSDFVHQEETEQDVEMTNIIDSGAPSASMLDTHPDTSDPYMHQYQEQSSQHYQHPQQSPLQKQLSTRSSDFWKLVEKAAEQPTSISAEVFDQTRQNLDGLESRDVIYSAMLLTNKAPENVVGSRPGTAGGYDSNNSSPNRAAKRQEREQASRLLESEASGRATNPVLQVLARMALRALQ